jgi:hypothetical protein
MRYLIGLVWISVLWEIVLADFETTVFVNGFGVLTATEEDHSMFSVTEGNNVPFVHIIDASVGGSALKVNRIFGSNFTVMKGKLDNIERNLGHVI